MYNNYKNDILHIVNKYNNNGEDIIFNIIAYKEFKSERQYIKSLENFTIDWVPLNNNKSIEKICLRQNHYINRVKIFNDALKLLYNNNLFF